MPKLMMYNLALTPSQVNLLEIVVGEKVHTAKGADFRALCRLLTKLEKARIDYYGRLPAGWAGDA